MINPFQDVNWRPNPAERRAFGAGFMVGWPVLAFVLGGLVWWKSGVWPVWALWLGGVGFLVGALCWAVPMVAGPLYVVWYAAGATIGLLVSNVLLVAVFYLVITPTGLVLRLLGKDPLERRWEAGATTYWKDAEKPVDAKSYFRQF